MYAFRLPQLILQLLVKLAEYQGILILVTPWWVEVSWLGEIIVISLCPLDLLPLLWHYKQGVHYLHQLQLIAPMLWTKVL